MASGFINIQQHKVWKTDEQQFLIEGAPFSLCHKKVPQGGGWGCNRNLGNAQIDCATFSGGASLTAD